MDADILSRQLASASEAYTQNAWWRSLVTVIPYVGSALDLLLASKGQAMIQDRIARLFDSLKEELSQVREEAVDKEYIQSEEWFDLIVNALDAATKTRDTAKIRLYAKVLRGALTARCSEASSPEEYLTVLANLTPMEVEVASAIYRMECNWPEPSGAKLEWPSPEQWKRRFEESVSVPSDDLSMVLLRLQSSGLVRDLKGEFLGYEGVYAITATFRKVVQYLGTLNTD